jgi:23S rRNA pseudouridine2457 synthase
MSKLYLFNKPFQVMSQFSDCDGKVTLARYIDTPQIYPAGRLDYDSEGLLLLTGDGKLQARIADPRFKLLKRYWVQVEGSVTEEALEQLRQGVPLKDGITKPAQAKKIGIPNIMERTPPIRERANIPTSWIELGIREGKNRQVRRMTAKVGFPTLRLIRHSIGPWSIDGLAPGECSQTSVNLPSEAPTKESSKKVPRHKTFTHKKKAVRKTTFK